MSTVTSTSAPSASFNIEDMRPRGRARIGAKLLSSPQWWMGFLRNYWPIAPLPGLGATMVTRFEDVQEVLAEEAFQQPVGPRMRQLMDGPEFALALPDKAAYRRQRRQIMEAFRLEDVTAFIAPRSAELAEEILAGRGRIDAVEELLMRVPTLLCRDYYGIEVPDPTLFGQWTMAISGYLFSSASKEKGPAWGTARAAADRLLPLLDQAIRTAKHEGPSPTIVSRLVQMQREGGGDPSDEMIRAELAGMVIGFVPTNTIASGNMLEMLLRRRDFMARAQEAARDGDDELLWRCLRETLRFKPINPGPFRECVEDYTIADGRPHATLIRAGTPLLVSTQSAMFDERNVSEPRRFRPDRPGHDSMVFGYGLHWCIGAFLAAAQITQTLKPLLTRRRLRPVRGRAGRMRRIGLLPAHLSVEFDA